MIFEIQAMQRLGKLTRPVTVLLFALMFAPPIHASTLTLGVVPHASPVVLAAEWLPIVRALSARTGDNIVFKTAPDTSTFGGRVRAGQYDIVYLNPQDYVNYHRTTGYRAIAHASGVVLQGVIIVRRDAPFRILADLADKDLAFPAPTSLAASILTRAALRRGNIPFSAHYVGSHDSVYLGVAKGLFAAGGGIEQTLKASPMRDSLRVLWRSEQIPPHPFAVLPSVTQETVRRITRALIDIGRDPLLRPALDRLGFPGFEGATDASYNPIRQLDRIEDK